MPTWQAAAAGLPTGYRPDMAWLMAHFAMAPQAESADELTTKRMVTEVAGCRTLVAALQGCTAGCVARWRLRATANGRRQAVPSASTEQRLMRDYAARGTLAQVAEVLAHMQAATQGLAANLQTHVRFVVPAAVRAATDYIAAVVPTGLLPPTHLCAEQLRNITARNLTLSASTPAASGDRLLARAAGPFVARLAARVGATLAQPAARLPAQRQGV